VDSNKKYERKTIQILPKEVKHKKMRNNTFIFIDNFINLINIGFG